jgi:ABC-type branched-subunit amino acid transport system substrate-binding protein
VERRQVAITVTAVVLALVLGVGITLLATSGGGDDEATDARRGSSTTTSSAVSTTTTTTLIPRPVVTVPTTPSPTIQIVPPSTTTPTTKAPKRKRPKKAATTTTTTVAPAAKPQAAPATEPPTTTPPTTAPPTTQPAETTSTSTSTTTTTVPAPTEPGITATQVRLTVVADDQATLDGASAWASALNRRGGIAGRKVRLDLLTTDGTPEGYDAAVATACQRSFAMVATHSRHDANVDPLSCGIPDLPVETTSTDHAEHASTYAAFPRRAGVASVGPYHWLRTELDDCCAQYVLVPADGPDRAPTETAIDAAAAAGFDTVATPDVALDAPSTEYDALAQDLVASGATFAASGLGPDSTLELRRAAVRAGANDVAAWYCDDRCYDPTFSVNADAEGQYSAIETVPFGDRRDVAELRAYLRATARNEDPFTYAGLRAYVAGVLFEEAAAAALAEHGDDGLTRARLLESLASIDAFTGRGLVGATDVGGRTPNGCYALLQVESGRFARVSPAERGSLDCGADNLVVLD